MCDQEIFLGTVSFQKEFDQSHSNRSLRMTPPIRNIGGQLMFCVQSSLLLDRIFSFSSLEES